MAYVGDIFRVNTHLGALQAYNQFKSNSVHLQKLEEKAATGKSLNEYADNPTYSKISDHLTARSRGLTAARDNVATAKNFLSIAEGGLKEIEGLLVRMKEGITQAADDANGPHERLAISVSLQSMADEIDDIVKETIAGDRTLLDGSYVNVSYQIGESTTSTLRFSIATDHTQAGLGIDAPNVSGLVFNAAGAGTALTNVDAAINTVLATIEDIGAMVGRLNFQEATLNIDMSGTMDTNSRLSDTDMAQNQLEKSRRDILQRTSTIQLTQANTSPIQVLRLFG